MSDPERLAGVTQLSAWVARDVEPQGHDVGRDDGPRDGEATEVSVRGQQVPVSEQGPTVVALDDQGPVILGRLGSLPLVGSSNEHEMVYTAGVPDRERRRRSSRS